MQAKQYYIYILASRSRTLYIGVTDDLIRRIYEHKNGMVDGFSKKYRTNRLVYYETTNDVWAAITREKQLKGWLRKKKVALIEFVNPLWGDLSEGWF